MSFFAELKRRNVIRVGAAYALVAWLLIQIADTLLPTFGAPEWVMPVFSAIVILGFPLALILSWVLELTPEGLKSTAEVDVEQSITYSTGQRLNYVIIGLLMLAVGFLFVEAYFPGDSVTEPVVEASPATVAEPAAAISVPAAPPPQREVLPNSVAVLPFENLSLDPEDAFFATGIHDEILNQLAKLSALNVIARTSVLQYANGTKPIPEIAEELNVETVMEGSVRYANGRVLVTTQLIDAQTNAHLWSESYNRDFADIFAIQADIAMNVANAVGAEFSLEEQARIETPATNSPAAYALLLQAFDLFATGAEESASIHALLDRAIGLDPDLALAYSTKAFMYSSAFVDSQNSLAVGAAEREELERRIRDNAEMALSLDPEQAVAHTALVGIDMYTWRWTAGREALEKARRDVNVGSWLLTYMGLRDESLAVWARNLELNPYPLAIGYSGMNFAYLGEYEAGLENLRTSIELQPLNPLMQSWHAYMDIALGDELAAIEQLQFTEQLMGDSRAQVLLPELAYAYGRIGRTQDAQRIFQELQNAMRDSQENAGANAMSYLAIGDRESALSWLEVAAEKAERNEPDAGFYSLMFIKMNVLNDPVLEEPEFVALRDRLTGS